MKRSLLLGCGPISGGLEVALQPKLFRSTVFPPSALSSAWQRTSCPVIVCKLVRMLLAQSSCTQSWLTLMRVLYHTCTRSWPIQRILLMHFTLTLT